LFIFFHVEETEPKEGARIPRILRVASMLGAGQRGINLKAK
jgi:hypothetical protein